MPGLSSRPARVCEFPAAAVTDCPWRGGLNQETGARSPKSGCARASAPRGLSGRPLLCFCSPRRPQARCGCNTGPASSAHGLLPVCPCPDPQPPSRTRTLAVGFRARPKSRRPHLAVPNLITPAETLAPSRVSCAGSGAFCGDAVHPTAVCAPTFLQQTRALPCAGPRARPGDVGSRRGVPGSP